MLETPPLRRDRRPARGRRTPVRLLGFAAAVLAAFAVGVALGQALEDGPAPATTQTVVRTLEPLPQEPATAP